MICKSIFYFYVAERILWGSFVSPLTTALISTKFRDFNFRLSFSSRVLNFAKLSENKVIIFRVVLSITPRMFMCCGNGARFHSRQNFFWPHLSEFLDPSLVASCYENRDKLRRYGPSRTSADFILPLYVLFCLISAKRCKDMSLLSPS